MPVLIACPKCRGKIELETSDSDQKMQCPLCAAVFVVKKKPAQPSAAPNAAAPNSAPPPPSAKPPGDLPSPASNGIQPKKRHDDDAGADDLPRKKRRDEDEDNDDDRPRKKRRDDDDDLDDDDDRPRKKRRDDDDDLDDDDDRPRKKRRDDDDDLEDDDDRPRKKRRDEDDDLEDDDDRPRKKRRDDDDDFDDDDDRPRKKRSDEDDDLDEDDDRPRKKRRDEDDDDGESRRSKKKKKPKKSSAMLFIILGIVALLVLGLGCGLGGWWLFSGDGSGGGVKSAVGVGGGSSGGGSTEIALVNGEAKVDSKLTTGDPMDTAKKTSRCKVYKIKLESGKSYQMEMASNELMTLLRLEDSAGTNLPDGSKNVSNGQIAFECKKDDTYRIIATTLDSPQAPPGASGIAFNRTGPFTLKVKQMSVPVAAVGGGGDAGKGAGSNEIKLVNDKAKFSSKLTDHEPMDAVKKTSRCKLFTIKLESGKLYQIEMTSNDLETFLRLEDSAGKSLPDESKNAGGGQFAFLCKKDDTYHIIATTYDVPQVPPGGVASGTAFNRTGKFTLNVRVNVPPPTPQPAPTPPVTPQPAPTPPVTPQPAPTPPVTPQPARAPKLKASTKRSGELANTILGEMAGFLEGVKDAKSAKAAAPHVDHTINRLIELKKKADALPKLTPDEETRMEKKLQPEMSAATQRLNNAYQHAITVSNREPTLLNVLNKLTTIK